MLTPDRTFGQAGFDTDQLVVAIPDLDLLTGHLRDKNITASLIDSDETLSLALIGLPPNEVEAFADGQGRAVHGAGAGKEDPYRSALDVLIDSLYADFRGSYVPTFGKNRLLDKVSGNHTISVGDEGLPSGDGVGALGPRQAAPGAGVAVGVADTVLHPSEWFQGAYL